MNDHDSQYRFDPLQQRWVIIASERGKRPDDFLAPPSVRSGKQTCPFCPGNEDKTPSEIAYVPYSGSDRASRWQVRVVPNKYPALKVEGQPHRAAEGLYDEIAGVGAHEVIIETPDHDSSLADRPVDEIWSLFRTYRERLVDLVRDRRLRYILVFKNHGEFAGASIEHPHSQIMATTVTPKIIQTELESCREHYDRKNRCLVCDILRQEIHERSRITSIDDRYLAFSPYASRFPFEQFIAPRRHQHDFTRANDDELRALAVIMKDVLSRLNTALDNPPYNFVLHTIPNVHSEPRTAQHWANLEVDFHWHIELLPRLTRVAGFEWGTGIYINPTPPETAAAFLRDL